MSSEKSKTKKFNQTNEPKKSQTLPEKKKEEEKK